MSFLLYLAEQKRIAEEDIPRLESLAQEKSGGLDAVLTEQGFTLDELLAEKSRYFSMPVISLTGKKIPSEVLRAIPEESARHYGVVPVSIEDSVFHVGMVDPDNTQARDAVQFIATKLGMPFRLHLVSSIDFEAIIDQYKNLTGEVTEALSEITPENAPSIIESEVSPDGDSEVGGKKKLSEEESRIVEDAPVTKIVAVILKHAADGNASDVHVEHMGDKVRVRFRVDGVMYTSLILPPNIHPAVVARIKILANLKLDEKRKPQDGRFSAKMDNRKIDFRVSTFPSYYGEKVVMRILDPSRGMRTLVDMGFNEWQMAKIREAVNLPYGMILVTGPTGSGKSTSLYAMLGELDREQQNVISLEDPVEYNIAGVSQSQVRPEIGYTFANGLRSILRQDPDVIMVGEIRDKETAQLAVQAALTGHLVFSTLHTNNAAGVIPRLIDMEVDPYLIAPTLSLVIGQRLLRTLCDEGKQERLLSESEQKMIDRQFADLPSSVRSSIVIPDHVYDPGPSPTCPTGTKGRTGVFEFLEMNRELEHVILTNPTEQSVYEYARNKGMLTMRDDALQKAFQGIIPFEEVNNII